VQIGEKELSHLGKHKTVTLPEGKDEKRTFTFSYVYLTNISAEMLEKQGIKGKSAALLSPQLDGPYASGGIGKIESSDGIQKVETPVQGASAAVPPLEASETSKPSSRSTSDRIEAANQLHTPAGHAAKPTSLPQKRAAVPSEDAGEPAPKKNRADVVELTKEEVETMKRAHKDARPIRLHTYIHSCRILNAQNDSTTTNEWVLHAQHTYTPLLASPHFISHLIVAHER